MKRFIDWLLGRNQRIERLPDLSWEPPRKPPVMNEGDFHSGPEGYTPNTAYPETQYGSNFDEDAAWNEDEWR